MFYKDFTGEIRLVDRYKLGNVDESLFHLAFPKQSPDLWSSHATSDRLKLILGTGLLNNFFIISTNLMTRNLKTFHNKIPANIHNKVP